MSNTQISKCDWRSSNVGGRQRSEWQTERGDTERGEERGNRTTPTCVYQWINGARNAKICMCLPGLKAH